jgi:plasmid stabilization system protein ParE
MKFILVVTPEANDDILDAKEWYEAESSRASHDFVSIVKKSLNFISENPYSGRIIRENVRAKYLGKFPYIIYYEIYDNYVIVLEVIHAARNSKYN